MPAELPHPTLSTPSVLSLPISTSDQPASVSRRGPARRVRPATTWLLTLLLLLLSGATTAALAQTTPPPNCSQDEKFINTWYFGYRAGLNFNAATDSIPPTVLTDGRMVAPAGSGVMSDGMGNLLFYSNGDTIWSRDHKVMPNGTGLGGNRLTTDGPLPIRLPGSPVTPGGPTRYLIFTQDARGGAKGLSYSEISIPTGQQGDVVGIKNTPLTLGTTEKMTGVLHKNGCHVWIIVHGWGTDTTGTANRGDAFLAYLVTEAGVQPTPVISKIGALHALSASAQGYRGQMKVSPDGQQLAVARFSGTLADSSSTVELFAFDAATGIVSGRKVIDSGAGGYYGVEFSPSRSRLYVTVLSPPKLLQFDLTATNIPGSKRAIPLKQTTPVNLGSMQAAPDGKIYVARENQSALGFITYPDSLGAKARYADDSLTLRLGGRRSGLGLPNFNQSSLLRVGFGAQSTACLEMTFQAGSPIPNPESYAWIFGDPGSGVRNTSSEANPKHVFPAPGDYTVTLRITNFCFCREVTSLVRVPGAPTPGSIGASQTLCGGATPAPLTSTAAPGAGTGQFTFQWQSSPDNATWADIGGANAPNFSPGGLTVTTYFRRLVTSGFCSPRTPTAVVVITVLPILAAGSIAADQTVCAGSAPAPLKSTAPATGGIGQFSYQWDASLDNATWTPIANATGADYAPGPLTATTYFRRRVASGPCAAISNTLAINILPALAAGSIAANQAICAGTAPAPLTSETPATGSGTITYQWEFSPDNATWNLINGAVGPAYAPGQLGSTAYFRRRASSASACAPVVSNVVAITVAPALAAGTIGTSQALCPGATPAPLTSTAGASGGTGTFAYQWESSADNSNWAPIANATGAGYAPGPLTATTYFRRRATSGTCGLEYSSSIALTLLPPLNAGSISANQAICTGATPSSLSSTTEAGGGTGTFTYQWEFSTDNVSWNPVTGATNLTYAPGPLTATTYFRRRATSGTGTCSTAVSNVLTILVQPIVTPAVSLATPPAQCPGTAFTFTAVATNVGPTPAYQWFVNNVAVATGPSFSSSTLVTGDQVRVEVTPTAGLCVTTNLVAATVTVTRTPTPQPTLAIAVQPDGPVCLGAPLTFSIASVTEAGPAPDYQWQVNGNDVTGARGTVFTSTALRNGQIVTLRLRTTNVCGQPVTAVSNGVVVRIQPPVVVNAGPDKEILLGTSVVLEGSADGNYPVTWTPATGLTIPANDPLHPVAAPNVTTTYTLSAGAGGCASSDQVTVTVRPPIRIPNAFTPNNDGRDDTWQIEFIEQFPDNTVSVFNRWGNRVFSTEHYSRANEWRGDINGQPAPVGTYYYVVVTKGPLGRSYAGSITILY